MPAATHVDATHVVAVDVVDVGVDAIEEPAVVASVESGGLSGAARPCSTATTSAGGTERREKLGWRTRSLTVDRDKRARALRRSSVIIASSEALASDDPIPIKIRPAPRFRDKEIQ